MLSYYQILHRRLHKLAFYAQHVPMGWLPHACFSQSPERALAEFARLPEWQQAHIRQRVNYYNQLTESFSVPSDCGDSVATFTRKGKSSSYFYDLKSLLRYFPLENRFEYLLYDVTHVPERPMFVKSRPIQEGNENSVVLKLDSVRHFYVVKDPYRFEDKQDRLMWRGAAHQAHRIRFLEQFHHYPELDVGCVHKSSQDKPYHRNYLTVHEQLRYRYILSIEGNDVATNLKWIMASQSVAVMMTPRFETWLMEGLLKPDVHYIHVQDDYSDLMDKLAFYRAHPDATQKIVAQANAWMQPFFDKKLEWITQILVMQKYFELAK